MQNFRGGVSAGPLQDINQNDARYLKPGQPVELTFKFFPGRILTGKVESIPQAVSSGQLSPSGQAATPKDFVAAPVIVRVKLDDDNIARQLPAGSAGDGAIFTDRIKSTHVIRKVLLRQLAIVNYVWPY